jgi:peptide/nickel transport system substrate-binding protein
MIDVGNVPVTVSCGGGAVWVATLAERILRIEPGTNTVTAEAAIGLPVAMAADEETVCVTDPQGRLWCVDPHTAAITQTIPVGSGAMGLALGEGSAWVAQNLDGAVLRVDLRSGRAADPILIGQAPTDVALADGTLWVSVQSEGTV